jgi:putative tricarboxylic transport membrane protein
MRRADQITGILMFLFGAVVMEGARRMPPSGTFGPGAGFLPFWLGAAMAVLSVILLTNATREPAQAGGRAPFPTGRKLLPLIETALGLAAFILLLEWLGFLLSTALLTAFLLKAVEREGWVTTGIVAVANAGALYVVFQILLGVNLPKSILGF